MIKMIKGTYGRVVSGGVEAMTKYSAPFSLPETREAELIAAGVAVKVETPEPGNRYAKMSMVDLRKAAAALGVDTGTVKSKTKLITMLEAAKAASDDEKQDSGLLTED